MKESRRTSLITQVLILTALFILLTGVITYESQRFLSSANVTRETEDRASEIAAEMTMCIREYPSYRWLLSYCYQHWQDMDIEYDAEYGDGTRTEEKYRLLVSHHPEFHLRYADEQDIAALSAEDQKLYAEITYSWLITRINKIKRSHEVDYLFCVLSDAEYKTQFFLLSAADTGSTRGTQYEQVYPLGVQVQVGESQEAAMRGAKQQSAFLADAGNYVDFYSYLETIDSGDVFIGMTYDLTHIRDQMLVTARWGTFYAVLYQMLLSAAYLTMTILMVLRPLKRVQRTIRLYTLDKDSREAELALSGTRGGNEIARLSRDVLTLAKEIDDYVRHIREITTEQERMRAELSMAKQLQASMLPSEFPPFPEKTQFDLYATMEPARMVGGDFYDFLLIDDDHLCLMLADVSGKGIPAALFMMASKIVMENCARMEQSASEILSRTNEAICQNNEKEMFLTAWLGILELSTGKLTAASAGHEYPIVRRAGGQFEVLRDKHGFVIGGLAGTPYTEYTMQLEPGSALFLYSDGLPEAANGTGEMFGMERTLSALNEDPGTDPKETIDRMRDRVSAFVGDAEQFDDLTMLCLTYKG